MSRNLHHRITCQKIVLTEDGSGGYVETFQDIAEVWADITEKPTTVDTEARQHKMRNSLEIKIRYQDAALACRQIILNSRKFRVQSFSSPGEKRRFIIFTVVEDQ